MYDLARKAKRLSGHTLDDLQEMLDTMAREPQPQIYSVKTVAVPEPSNVVFTAVPHTMHFRPGDVRREIVRWFEHFHPTPNLNRGRLSGSATSLTFGAQTGRGSDRSCVIKRTLGYDYHSLITLVHQLAQNAAGSVLPYLGFQILRLGPGQNLNQRRDYHNHADYPNHTMKFGKCTGGSLQMVRNGQWYSYDNDCQWMSFDALKVVHRVTPVQTGARYSITLYTLGKLDRLTAQDWDNLAKCGFPIYLYEPLPAKMRRLTTPSHVTSLNSEPERTQEHDGSRQLARELYHYRSHVALLSHHLDNNEHLWDDVPVPSVADPTDANLVKPKTLLDCCKDAQEFMDEYDLNDGYDTGTLYLMRVIGHRTRMLSLFEALMYHAESNDRRGYLWTLTNTLRLIFQMANEAGLETVLSAAYSLKHATDMEKSFPTQDEAFDKAMQMGLSPEQAARQITPTPTGQFALYDAKKGDVAKSDRWRPPDIRSLIKIAQTEQGRSEVSCVLEEHQNLMMAKPMIFSEETGPTHFTFANQIGVQTDDDSSDGSIPEELARTIQSHPWLANLEISSGCTPTWSSTLPIPRKPHPDGPTIMTWHQLEDVHKAIVTAHREQDVSEMLKGVVSNMHLLAKFAREAGFLPYIGHAQYIYECYLKSQINSSRPPSGCDISSVWSLQTRIGQGYAEGMFLGHATISVTSRSEWHLLSCHSSIL